MLTNYLKIALRTLRKKPFYTGINILGLAIGMAACLLISLYVLDELSYDRFHEQADRIYRVTTETNFNGRKKGSASTNHHVAEVIDDEIPEVEVTTRVQQSGGRIIQRNDRRYAGQRTIAVDSNFFSFFTFPLIEGNPATALDDPASVVLTEDLAQSLFNRSVDVVGETIEVGEQIYRVSGVAKNPPTNAHFHFDLIKRFEPWVSNQVSWGNINSALSTYFLLAENATVDEVPRKIREVGMKYNPRLQEAINTGNFDVNFFAQPLTRIHLHSHLDMELEGNSDIRYVYIFSAIALFILVIAVINFVNLSTARSADRAKEVGVRKTLGSARGSLIGQFLTESTIVSLMAMLLALGFTEAFRRPFNTLASKSLTLGITENSSLWLTILIIALGVGVLAGLYPALYLTRFEPIAVLRGRLATGSKGRRFRNVLVVFQFATTIGLIVCTGLVYQQLRYMQNKSLGYTKDNIILLPNRLGKSYDAFSNEIRSYPQVLSTAVSQQSPHQITNGQGGLQVRGQDEDQMYQLNRLLADHDFLTTFDITLKEGRNFSEKLVSDTAAMILNEAAVQRMGIDNPLQTQIRRNRQWYQVIGVVKDFHFQSLHNPITPLFIVLDPDRSDYHTLAIRVSGQEITRTLARLRGTWSKYVANAPFDYSFLDQDYDALYRAESRLGKVFGIFTGLAIFVACLGLLALAAFLAEQRTKEIGIRKVLGASVQSIVLLLSKGFTVLVLVAFVIAVPLAYYAMRSWLSDFAYRIDISVWPFLLAGGVALLIAWLTVSYQSIKAALANPVDALRDE